MKKTLSAMFILAALCNSADAGMNTCDGKIETKGNWTFVSPTPSTYPYSTYDGKATCKFETTSTLGKHILSICPNNSECSIELPLPKNGDTGTLPKLQIITKILQIYQTKTPSGKEVIQ